MSDVSTDNGTQRGAAAADYNFPALIFGVLLIVIIAGGNVLVCLSVYLEKALKTTTNYFIVSLAFADLLLAVLVLPLFVYAEVSAARRGAARHGPARTGPGFTQWWIVQPRSPCDRCRSFSRIHCAADPTCKTTL